MPRAPFTHEFEVFRGPNQGNPNALVAVIPGRYVKKKHILPQGVLMQGTLGWVTTPSYLPIAVQTILTGNQVVLLKGTEDRIACAALGLEPTPIRWCDLIAPPGQQAYVRLWIGAWPGAPGPD